MKTTKTGNRGTKKYVADVTEQNWAGESFRKIQEKRLSSAPDDTIIHLGRGTRTTNAGDMPNPSERQSTRGITRVTKRGTASRPSRNIN
jgi:hypothetical protein